MVLRTLDLLDFRTYPALSLELGPSGAVFKGPNGAGKTNILEAIHMLCVGRSQRGATRGDMIRHSADACSIRGSFEDPGAGRLVEAQYGFDRSGAVRMNRDGRAVTSLRTWFGATPVVSFGPEDMRLLTGAPSERRRFLDLLIGQADSRYIEEYAAYTRALQNRARILTGGSDEKLLDVYEAELARRGWYIHQARREACVFCQELFAGYYRDISGLTEEGEMRLRGGAGVKIDGSEGWESVFSNTLKHNRKRDAELGFCAVGPHRDDLLVLLDKRHARTFGSQGQLRSLALALRLCAVRFLERFRGGPLVLLVDDAFSELDDARIGRVYPRIRELGQVFMATPVDRVPIDLGIPQFRVTSGGVTAV